MYKTFKIRILYNIVLKKLYYIIQLVIIDAKFHLVEARLLNSVNFRTFLFLIHDKILHKEA